MATLLKASPDAVKKLVAALRESAEAASRVMLEQLGVKRDSNVFKQFELHATSKATTLAAMRISTPVDNFVDLATQQAALADRRFAAHDRIATRRYCASFDGKQKLVFFI